MSIASLAFFLIDSWFIVSSFLPNILEIILLFVSSIFNNIFSATVNPGINENS